MDSQHDVVQGTLLAVSWSQLIAQVRFFSPKQKVRPTFIFRTRRWIFFPLMRFSFTLKFSVGLSMSCQIPATKVQRIVVEIQGLHAFRCRQLLRMGTLVTRHVPLWVLECLKRMAAWCFFFFFFSEGFGFFWGPKHNSMDFFQTISRNWNNFQGCFNFQGSNQASYFFFITWRPEVVAAAEFHHRRHQTPFAPNFCTWSQILLEAELGYNQRPKNPSKLQVW